MQEVSKRPCPIVDCILFHEFTDRSTACVYVHVLLFFVCFLLSFQYIMSRLSQLNCSRWNVTEHSFEQSTVVGRKRFTNIIATLDPEVDRRLVLVAHYDSKILTNRVFLGATDSALPVALLLNVALALDAKLMTRQVCACVLFSIIPGCLDGLHIKYKWCHNFIFLLYLQMRLSSLKTFSSLHPQVHNLEKDTDPPIL